MKPVAIGIRAHSGWGALIVVAGNPGAIEVLERRRIEITAPNIDGARQPYHFAQGQKVPDAERYLAECAEASGRLAFGALRETVDKMRRHDKIVAGCAILLASGRNLPALQKILASHPLIHTAEGEFFRQSFRTASEQLKIKVTGVRERELEACARAVFGTEADSLKREIAGLGSSLGSPWTADQKNACLAALLVLADREKSARVAT
jgi:hypothetical protein